MYLHLQGVVTHEDGGSTLLLNVGNYLLVDTLYILQSFSIFFCFLSSG